MKKYSIFAFTILFFITLSSLATAATTDYISVEAGDKLKWEVTIEGKIAGVSGSASAQYKLEITAIEEVEGGALVKGTMTISKVKSEQTDDTDLQFSNIVTKEDIAGDIAIPVASSVDVYIKDVLGMGYWVINKNAAKEADGDIIQTGISISYSVQYNEDGILEDYETTIEADADNTVTTSITLKSGIPGYPLTYVMFAGIIGMAIIIRKRRYN